MEDLYGLYLFDSALRGIFIKFILIVERNIKSSLSYHFCNEFGDSKNDYLNPGCYDYKGKKVPVIQKAIKVMSGQCRKDSDYVYVRHYMNRYQYVPLWILLHVLTLGQVSKLYTCQKGRVKIKVCQDFGNIKTNKMEKMLSVMTKFRNVCAHNERLFDYRTKDAIFDMDIHRRLFLGKELGRYVCGKNDLFAMCIILKLLLSEADFGEFCHNLILCFRKYPVHKNLLEKMGFPQNWRRITRIKKFLKKDT